MAINGTVNAVRVCASVLNICGTIFVWHYSRALSLLATFITFFTVHCFLTFHCSLFFPLFTIFTVFFHCPLFFHHFSLFTTFHRFRFSTFHCSRLFPLFFTVLTIIFTVLVRDWLFLLTTFHFFPLFMTFFHCFSRSCYFFTVLAWSFQHIALSQWLSLPRPLRQLLRFSWVFLLLSM